MHKLPLHVVYYSNFYMYFFPFSTVYHFFFQLLSHSSSRNQHGPEAVLYLMLMVNYRKHEMTNPYTVNISLLDDELILNGYGQVRLYLDIKLWLSLSIFQLNSWLLLDLVTHVLPSSCCDSV